MVIAIGLLYVPLARALTRALTRNFQTAVLRDLEAQGGRRDFGTIYDDRYARRGIQRPLTGVQGQIHCPRQHNLYPCCGEW